jgi:hypothetical protein
MDVEGNTQMKYRSLESTIRGLLTRKLSEAKVETDPNDQVVAGGYRSKHFEMSMPAQKLYSKLPKQSSPDEVEKSVIAHDKLFAIEKKVSLSGVASDADVDQAKKLVDQIAGHAKKLNLSKEHDYIKKNLNNIVSKHKPLDAELKPNEDPLSKERFTRVPTDPDKYEKRDQDIDNLPEFIRSRGLRAQRKLKIIDGD